MATFWSGAEGQVTWTPSGGNPWDCANWTWNSDESNRLSEVTNANTSQAHAQYIATIDEDDGNFDVVYDSTATPDQMGLIRGAAGTVVLAYGNSTKSQTQEIIIGKVSKKLDTRNGAIVLNCTYKGNGPITVNGKPQTAYGLLGQNF